ncbi:hypothetical protein EWM64_g9877 [Hericium alpestre]|uniref:Uncharacterized protein n=1 Tax=Hericium alpestre TaxID=135208 RepID=A0A4Y9ZHB1_9AGAM|nr:hypothetical protein EWM64_g9877 [Hericium alpestre]
MSCAVAHTVGVAGSTDPSPAISSLGSTGLGAQLWREQVSVGCVSQHSVCDLVFVLNLSQRIAVHRQAYILASPSQPHTSDNRTPSTSSLSSVQSVGDHTEASAVSASHRGVSPFLDLAAISRDRALRKTKALSPRPELTFKTRPSNGSSPSSLCSQSSSSPAQELSCSIERDVHVPPNNSSEVAFDSVPVDVPDPAPIDVPDPVPVDVPDPTPIDAPDPAPSDAAVSQCPPPSFSRPGSAAVPPQDQGVAAFEGRGDNSRPADGVSWVVTDKAPVADSRTLYTKQIKIRGLQVLMRWYTLKGPYSILHPPAYPSQTFEKEDLFIHISSSSIQTWIWDGFGWKSIKEGEPHPSLHDHALWLRPDGSPRWVTRKTVLTYKSRGKAVG